MRCRSFLLVSLFSPLSFSLLAQPWQFGSPVNVTSTTGNGIFHHLESSGRRNIAVSGNLVAVVWEDNRDGAPAIYLAHKETKAAVFSDEIKVSGNGEAYEPSLVALGNRRFAVAWEEDGRIRVRIVTPSGPGPIIKLSDKHATQPSLSLLDKQLLLVYSSLQGRHGQIHLQRLAITSTGLRLQQNCPVDTQPLKDDQLYPTVTGLAGRVVVAWEDRRPGHTIIMAAVSPANAPCHFSSPQCITEEPSGPRPPYGQGYGVARVAMDRYGPDQLLAAWADKRNFREGYDIYASIYPAAGNRLFGKNIKVQDPFGGVSQQWHPAVAGHASGRVVVAWDDNRDGNANIMLSWLKGDGWSDDLSVPGASGPSEQNHPSLILDADGNLHLAWVERQSIGGKTRLRYLYAPLNE